MNPVETIREHFMLLRAAKHPATADYHCNVLYGYLQALRDTRQLKTHQYLRLHHTVTKAWAHKTKTVTRVAA